MIYAPSRRATEAGFTFGVIFTRFVILFLKKKKRFVLLSTFSPTAKKKGREEFVIFARFCHALCSDRVNDQRFSNILKN
jgi:hypothetical protein